MLKRFYIVAIILIVIAGLGAWLAPNQKPASEACYINTELKTTELKFEDKIFTTEIAETQAHKQQGLSERNCIDLDHAMLFNYELTGDYCFWMKDMNFPIDMVWLDDDKQVITVRQNVSPDTYPKTFCPDRPANTVLEFASGTAKAANIKVGSQFEFTLP